MCVCVCADATRSLVDANTASASSFFSLSFCCLRIFYLGSGDELLFIGVVFSINKTEQTPLRMVNLCLLSALDAKTSQVRHCIFTLLIQKKDAEVLFSTRAVSLFLWVAFGR